ncbi:hypothetical protein H6G36_25655 [Anabaena minutissima FACHB-250]|nr:hypothetical protein [Anabaena minutissima FACHB-250]
MYTQQEIVKLYKQLIPSIVEADGKLKITLRGQGFTIKQAIAPVQKVSTRNLQYR